MTTATEPHALPASLLETGTLPASSLDPDTGPLIALKADGLSQREIARRLHMSQPAVQRKLARLRDILDADSQRTRTAAWTLAYRVLLLATGIVIAAALATMAWG